MSDELNHQTRAFLHSVLDGDDPTHADQERVRAKVKARLAAGIAAGIAVLTTSKVTAATAKVATTAAATGMVGAAAPTAIAAAGTGTAVVGKIAAVFLVVAAVAGGTTAVVRHTQNASVASVPAPTVVVAPPPPAIKRASTAPVAPPALGIAPEALTNTPDTPPATTGTATEAKPVHLDSSRSVMAPVAAAPATTIATAVVTTSPLDEEIALVRDARAALRAGDAGHSLAILDEHDRRFPGGALSEDCAAERIYAFCALGRVDDARALAARFLTDHPVSPHAASVRASCGFAGGMN